MTSPISGINPTGEKTVTPVTTTPPDPTKKVDSQDAKSTTTKPRTDTLELSAAARAKQPAAGTTSNTQVSGVARAKQLHQQGKSVQQIASSMGVSVATVESYLGIAQTPATNSAANSAPLPPVSTPGKMSGTAESKPATGAPTTVTSKE